MLIWWRSLSNRSRDALLTLAVMALAAALRLPGLTLFLTADEARSWFGRSIIFLDALLRGDFANTAPGGTAAFIEAVSLSPAPGVTTMWAGSLGIVLAWLQAGAPGSLHDFLVNLPFDPLDPAMLFWLRLPGVLAAIAAVGLTYWWSRPLLGRFGAFLAAAFIALDPFSLALSRVLGHDALVATFMWLSLLALLRAINAAAPGQGNEKRGDTPLLPRPAALWLVTSGALGGLAWLSKYPALFIGAYTALALLAAGLWQSRASGASPLTALKRWFVAMLLWSAAAGAVFVLLWPAMWVIPLEPVGIILGDALRASGGAHQKGSYFLGQPVPDPGALFYPIVAIFRTTPVVFLGALLSLWLLPKPRPITENSRLDARLPLLVLWGYVLLYMLLVTVGGKKQDRYLLPAFPALQMLAALGYTYLLAVARRGSRPARWLWLLPASLVAIQLLMVLPYFPYYFSYYNPMAGGSIAASKTIQMGWGEGLNEAAAFLNTLPNAESTRVTAWYSTTFEPYFHGQAIYKIDDEKISRSAKPGLAADYVVFYINQLQRRLPSDGVLAWFQRSKPAHVVALNGQPYAWIYAAPAVANIFAGEVRLVGQAELLGFDLLDDSGARLDAVPSNSAATLRLYWEWQGKSPDDPIGLSLVDETGSTVGWANLVDPGTPVTGDHPLTEETGAIVTSDYALAVFPGTPPGRYGLRAWIDRPASGEVVGQFPLTAADAQISVSPPVTPPTATDIELDHASDAAFGPLRLLGHNFSGDDWQPGETRDISLFWALPDAPTGDSTAVLSLVPESAGIPAELSPRWEQAITPAHPTSQWRPGDIYRDNRQLTLPLSQPAGTYTLQLAVNGSRQTINRVAVGGRERRFEPPDIAHPLQATVGDSIELLGFETAPQAGSLAVTLVWRALATPPEDATVFVQLLDAAGQVIAQNDSAPQGGAAPTGSWAAGEVVVDAHSLPLPGGVVPDGSRLIAGMYRPTDGQRLLVLEAGGQPAGNFITLAEFD